MNQLPKYVLIDIENVLFPATELYLDSLKIVLAKSTKGRYLLKPEALLASELSTMSFSDMFEFLQTGEAFKAFSEAQKSILSERFYSQTQLMLEKGSKVKHEEKYAELFNWLIDCGMKIVICTNLPYEITTDFLIRTGYKAFVELVVTPDKYQRNEDLVLWPKPSIELYRKVMSCLSVEEEDLIAIEGTTSGINAAKLAKIKVVGTNSANKIDLKNIKEAFIAMNVIVEQ